VWKPTAQAYTFDKIHLVEGAIVSSEPLPTTHRQIHAAKDALHEQLQQALRATGLDNFAIDSLRLSLKHGQPTCPNGSEPQWEAEMRPDGSVVYRYVCKA
jgi:hypothetical protein